MEGARGLCCTRLSSETGRGLLCTSPAGRMAVFLLSLRGAQWGLLLKSHTTEVLGGGGSFPGLRCIYRGIYREGGPAFQNHWGETN